MADFAKYYRDAIEPLQRLLDKLDEEREKVSDLLARAREAAPLQNTQTQAIEERVTGKPQDWKYTHMWARDAINDVLSQSDGPMSAASIRIKLAEGGKEVTPKGLNVTLGKGRKQGLYLRMGSDSWDLVSRYKTADEEPSAEDMFSD